MLHYQKRASQFEQNELRNATDFVWSSLSGCKNLQIAFLSIIHLLGHCYPLCLPKEKNKRQGEERYRCNSNKIQSHTSAYSFQAHEKTSKAGLQHTVCFDYQSWSCGVQTRLLNLLKQQDLNDLEDKHQQLKVAKCVHLDVFWCCFVFF